MNILDDGITPALFCQKWIFQWNDTYVEIEHILLAIIIGLAPEPDLDSLNNEQRGKEMLSLIFFKTYTVHIKSSQSGISFRGITMAVYKKKTGGL